MATTLDSLYTDSLSNIYLKCTSLSLFLLAHVSTRFRTTLLQRPDSSSPLPPTFYIISHLGKDDNFANECIKCNMGKLLRWGRQGAKRACPLGPACWTSAFTTTKDVQFLKFLWEEGCPIYTLQYDPQNDPGTSWAAEWMEYYGKRWTSQEEQAVIHLADAAASSGHQEGLRYLIALLLSERGSRCSPFSDLTRSC